MARNGSGTYTAPNTFVSGNTITAAGHNQNWTDVASEMTNSVAADGQTSMTGPLKAANGTAAAPSVAFASDTNTGVYRHGADELGFSVGGVLAGWFDSAKKLWAIGAVDVAGALNVVGSFTLNSVAAFPVPTAQIANDAVTYAKIQNVTTARLLGRATAGSGDVEELTLGSGLAFVGTALTPSISPALIPNYLSGLTLSTAGSSATMSIAAGVANDSTNTVLMSLAAIAKTTASWVVGTAQGGLDTGAIANNTWYHFYVITRTDTGVVDVVFSTNATSPTMPTNYTLFRRIGSGKTNGSSQWTSFVQNGDIFLLSTPILDVSAATISGTASTQTLASIPTGVVIDAIGNIGINHASAGTSAYLSPLSVADIAASVASGFANLSVQVGGQFVYQGAFRITVNTSAQFRSRASAGSTTLNFLTIGWIDTRGQ